MEFYDGKRRPNLNHGFEMEDLERICFNCGQRLGAHVGYNCAFEETKS